MKKQIGLVGLGKMGKNLAINLKNQGWNVIVYNRTTEVAEAMSKEGFDYAKTIAELCSKLTGPRVIWTMLPAGDATHAAIFGKEGISQYLQEGDYLIDGANSNYQDTLENYQALAGTGINFCDVGVSGGPSGALNGACLMIGGNEACFKYLEDLFKDISLSKTAYQFFAGPGAGHFVKMVHNGIEYGMMQAMAEGFAVLKASPYGLDLQKVAGIYNNGSVITSRLSAWLLKAFQDYGTELKGISGSVEQSGEALWTVNTAQELNVPVAVIKTALDFRSNSQSAPSYTGQVLTALRNEFGGHAVSHS